MVHYLAIAELFVTFVFAINADPSRGYSIPLIDLSNEIHRQVIVDQEQGQYLGHPSTVLLEDGKTILCVYPKGHGKGSIVYKKHRWWINLERTAHPI